MARAGAGVVAAIMANSPQSHGRAVILCGPGNNGGDGYVIARLMHAIGWQVRVLHHGDTARLPPDARQHFDLWTKIGPVWPLRSDTIGADGADVVVDALFGIGQRAPMDAVLAPVIAFLQNSDLGRPYIVAVDLPTGYDADTGVALAAHPMPADLIVTFHAAKPCHLLPPLCDIARVVVDLGLHDNTRE